MMRTPLHDRELPTAPSSALSSSAPREGEARPVTPSAPRPDAAAARRSSVPVVAIAAALLLSGCRQDMHDQPKYEPLEPSALFADGASARTPPPYTVARDAPDPTDPAVSGLLPDGDWLDELPMALDAELLARGQERFDIFCAPCHDRLGGGRGMIVLRGFYQPPTYHQDRLREAPLGYLYDVISNGYGLMSGYGSQVPPRDRWAIAAWIRVLQRSQFAPQSLLTELDRERVAEAWIDPAALPDARGGDHGETDGDHGEGGEAEAH
ncbi:MAG TPA: cytochrome c [Thermoanaerobaculia bacterium]|nr:cytochrome c [Thermoanaerobaculia bacterium]